MTTKYTILSQEEITPIKTWLANRHITEVAKTLGCSRKSLQRDLSFNKDLKAWNFSTERLEKLKELMK